MTSWTDFKQLKTQVGIADVLSAYRLSEGLTRHRRPDPENEPFVRTLPGAWR